MAEPLANWSDPTITTLSLVTLTRPNALDTAWLAVLTSAVDVGGVRAPDEFELPVMMRAATSVSGVTVALSAFEPLA